MTTWSETNGCADCGCDGGGGTDCECLCNPMTSMGDMIVGGAAGTPTRVGVSTEGYLWRIVGGVPAWANPAGLPNQLPTGAGAGSTVYYNGSTWAAGTNLQNDGSHIGIGVAPSGHYDVEWTGTSWTGIDVGAAYNAAGGVLLLQRVPIATAANQRLGGLGLGASVYPVLGGGASVLGYSTEAWSDSARGGRLSFLVTPNGTVGTYVEAMRLNHNRYAFIGPGADADPTSVVQTGGAIAAPTAAKSANYTLTATDSTCAVDATGGAKTITLPDATGCPGRVYRIQKTDSSGNAVTIATTGGQTVGGASTKSLGTQNLWADVQSDGTNWLYFLGVAG